MIERILKIKRSLFSSNYNLNYLKADILSALSVALLMLPQSIAYAMIVGLPIHCGVLAAIFGSLITSLLGHSRHLISGPTNATALLIQAGVGHILYTHFYEIPPELKGGLVLQLISQVVLFIGIIQILISVLKLGGFTQFISRSVMMGYILGVTLSIWISQFYHIFSIERPAGKFSPFQMAPYLLRHIQEIHPASALIGALSFLLLIVLKRMNRRLPRSFITLSFMGLLAYGMQSFFGKEMISTLAPANFEIKSLLHFHQLYTEKGLLQDLLFVSFAIALLSIFEVNSISKLISAKSGQSVKSNRDILGVGISNLWSSFFLGTLPSSGSPSRSINNYQNGAKSRLAGLFIGAFVILLIGSFYPLIKFIPVASISAMLIMIGYEIIDFKLLKICLKATKRDALVLIVTTLSCLVFQLDIALFIGISLSLVLYLRLAAKTNILEYVFTKEGHFKPAEKHKERLEKRIRILNMEGHLFFGSVDSIQQKFNYILSDHEVQILILRFNHAQHLDASICYFLEVLARDLKKQGKSLYLCEMMRSSMRVVNESPHLKKLGDEYLYEMEDSSSMKATKRAFAHALSKLNEKTLS